MSHGENKENLLIDFSFLNVDDQNASSSNHARVNNDAVVLLTPVKSTNTAKPTSESLLCSSQPLYKLLNFETNDIQDNNPFDHLDKQACLSDDPFEIVENAALVLSDAQTSSSERVKVETGTLISLDSPINIASESKNSSNIETAYACDTPKSSNDTRNAFQNVTQSQDSVQNTSQKLNSNSKNGSPKSLASPSGKSRSKTKSSTSLNLLKYSLSNSRTDLTTESGSLSDDNQSGDEAQQKKQKVSTVVRHDSGADDSFDDIWATKPNLIDSQNDIDIDVDSDIDNDIAKLNIPMLSVSTADPKMNAEFAAANSNQSNEMDEPIETKALNRNELREKLASIRQKNPSSPAPIDVTTTIPIHNQTVDILVNRKKANGNNNEDEPVTPKSQYSSVLLQQSSSMENPNALIENLKKLVDQCNDKSKQTTANHLLDNLCSILTTNNDNDDDDTSKNQVKKRSPQPIKRQGTFSIEKNSSDIDESVIPKVNCAEENTKADPEIQAIDPSLSQVVKQIQNVLGAHHQNINVLQTNVSSSDSSAPVANPTYIVVMAQPATGFEDEDFQKPYRNRSQSLTLKDKPLSANRTTPQQQKVDQTNRNHEAVPISTPIKRPILQRRSSFGALTRTTSNIGKEPESKPANIPLGNPSTLIRRRSFQGSAGKLDEPVPVQAKPLNPVTRRRSFQVSSTTSKIRSPSPKTNLNSYRAPITTGTLTRRKSLVNDLTKDSPQKMKTSYGIMKKPAAPPASKFKIRVSQAVGGRSAPLRAVVPMNRVASLLLINETVSSVDENKSAALITSTPRCIASTSPAAKSKTGMN